MASRRQATRDEQVRAQIARARRGGEPAGRRHAPGATSNTTVTLGQAFTGLAMLPGESRARLAARLAAGSAARHGTPARRSLAEPERLGATELPAIEDASRRRLLSSWFEEALLGAPDLRALRTATIGELMPGAALAPDAALALDRLGMRLQLTLERAGVTRWSHVLASRVGDLLAITNLGTTGLRVLLGASFERSLVGLADETRSRPGDELASLLLLERLASSQPVLEALLEARASGAGERSPASDRLAGLAEELLQRSAPWALSFDGLRGLLDAVTDEKDRAIFTAAALSDGRGPSMVQLGAEQGVTSTRVAQRRDRAAAQVRAALEASPPPLPWLVRHLQHRLGRVVRLDRFEAELGSLGLERDPTNVALLRWLAGPYEAVPGSLGWLAVEHRALDRLVDEALARDGGVTELAPLRESLEAAGVMSDMALPWLGARGVAVVKGGLALRATGPLADAVERALEALGRPAGVAELAELLAGAGRHTEPAELEQVLRARRFRQLDSWGVVTHGLAGWDEAGAPATRRGGARGGQARFAGGRSGGRHDAVEQDDARADAGGEQQALPGLAALGIEPPAPEQRWAASDPSPGLGEERDSPAPAAPAPGARELDVAVDEELLRGAEGPVPRSLVDALAIGYRQRRTFASRFGPVSLGNDGAEPARGPLRPVALAAGARRGDLLHLRFADNGAVEVEVVARGRER